ncbi:MAG: amino acid ABC transporter substrate-binding protein [Alphaproteobacteria bacterium]|nr:MAG: amino acid ABC transporter substrate-binding protein [Alphaproteobacteria bacterium]
MRNHLLTLAIAVIMCWLLVQATLPKINEFLPEHVAKESAFDRVMRSQALHCGYGVWAPIMIKDANTGAMSGIFYDYMDAMGKSLNLKIQWTEVSWSDFAADLASGKIDAMCAGIWPTGTKSRAMDFTAPIYYVAIHTFARADDTRFDHALDKINSKDITIASMDGEISNIIASADFKDAKLLSLPSNASQPQILLNVATGKADVTFQDAATGQDFMNANPGKVKMVPGGEFIRTFGNTIAVAKGQDELKDMLNTASAELLQSGVVDGIIKKYEKYPGSFYRVAKPYQPPEIK